ncbi:MAG: undecaprenyl-diphosphate phosphatase [Clostridia bacterium]|nr:undecaprenyl-diphosphate phosphatase [Clostridia bacterium]
MTWYYAIILGIVQGLTEFLPISSSGHLVLASHLLNIPQFPEFDLFLHLGTLFSVCLYYRKKLIELLKPPFNKLFLLIIASLPAAILAIIFKESIKSTFTVQFLPIGFSITALFLVLSDVINKGEQKPTLLSAFGAGVFQGLATLPGISRSASTTFASLIFKVDKNEAVDFAFLMSVPIIFGGTVFAIPDVVNAEIPVIPTVLGVITSFITGLISIKITLFIFKNNKARYFAYYLILISLLLLLFNVL